MSAPYLGAEPEVVVAQQVLDVAQAKAQLRATIRAQRARRSASDRARLDAARTAALLGALGDFACVACYLSVGDEPSTSALVSELSGRGVRVLVPLLAGRRSPAFGVHSGPEALRPGLWGIPEPADADEVPLSDADVVLCSGLAATTDGRRLGVGGGWYDRALAGRRPGAEAWVLLNDDEVVADLPVTDLDQRVAAIATETGVRRAES